MFKVFILNASNAADAEMTRSNLAHVAPDWEVKFLTNVPGKTMNELLQSYEKPFFITLLAGDRLQPQFVAELTDRLACLPENAAGLIYERHPTDRFNKTPMPDSPMHPLVWRTQAVKLNGQPYFALREMLPFDSYILQDKMFQLGCSWGWPIMSSSMWKPSRTRKPAWQRSGEEWALVRPLLEAKRGHTEPTEPSLISIVICSYNNAEYLPWCLRSVFAQSTDNWRLIVVDDASTDDTWSQLQALPQTSRIKLLRNPINRGKSHCLNNALAECATPWLLELDADDWLTPDCLEKLLPPIHEAASDTACLYGDHSQWTERARKELVYNGRHQASENLNPESLLENASPLAPRCYRVDALRRLGGWSIAALYEGRLYEDFEMILRLAKFYRIRHISEMLYHRRIRSSSITHLNTDRYAVWKGWMRQQLSASEEEDLPG